MVAKKILVYFLIILLIAYPVSAGDVSLNRWVLNITLNENGFVDVMIQSELQNSGPSTLDGFSFVVPFAVEIDKDKSSGVTLDDEGKMNSNSIDVKKQVVSGGTNIIVSFDKPIESGKKWRGRLGYKIEKIVTMDNSTYSFTIPIDAPQATISGKSIKTVVPEDVDITSQMFLPKGVEVTSITPKPSKNLFQNNIIVPTWFSGKLNVGDTISIKVSVSEVLNKIVETEEKINDLSTRIDEAKKQGLDVSNAEIYIGNAIIYNNEQALGEYWKKDSSLALEYVGYANDELENAEVSLSNAGKTQIEEPAGAGSNEQSPGFVALIMLFALLVSVLARKKS